MTLGPGQARQTTGGHATYHDTASAADLPTCVLATRLKVLAAYKNADVHTKEQMFIGRRTIAHHMLLHTALWRMGSTGLGQHC